ncbi:hypothetical protein C8Q80DRAFT_1125343 [Daedaleopsis nitida]|nr:hypothetical protein C8Q80DRAFT_1125343 [Daedaleopsis nitida]
MASAPDAAAVAAEILPAAHIKFSLLVHEYMITLEQEINLFWKSQTTGATILFFSNRLMGIFSSSNYDVRKISQPNMEMRLTVCHRGSVPCAAMSILLVTLEIAQYIPWAASYYQAETGYVSIMVVDSDTWSLPWIYPCNYTVSIPEKELFYLCLFIADAILLAVTWRATYQIVKLKSLLGMEGAGSFSTVLYTNGAMYTTFNIICTLVYTILYACGGRFYHCIPIFLKSINGILVSRFLFDLQGAKQKLERQHSVNSIMSSIEFSRVLGSIGISLQHEDMLTRDADNSTRL